MMDSTGNRLEVLDQAPEAVVSVPEILDGLRRSVKQLPCKLLYDAIGSELFDRICELDEYYPTRTELAIMDAHIEEMCAAVGPRALLVEYGSGSSLKTRTLLAHLEEPMGYIPIDISRDHLRASVNSLAAEFPELAIRPICADYSQPVALPEPARQYERTVVYFPGSTIGNFHPAQAQAFLERLRAMAGPAGGVLIGVDLKKDPGVLHRAYNDAGGITAAFNLNILRRLNREAGSDFRLEYFRHYAFYQPLEGRVEMHLVSCVPQRVALGGASIDFDEGESIWTESSYKYTLPQFAQLAAAAGLRTASVWTDARRWFSVHYLVAA